MAKMKNLALVAYKMKMVKTSVGNQGMTIELQHIHQSYI